MRSLAREESEESPEESDLKKLASVTDERHPHRADLTFRRGQLALSSGRSIRTAEIWM